MLDDLGHHVLELQDNGLHVHAHRRLLAQRREVIGQHRDAASRLAYVGLAVLDCGRQSVGVLRRATGAWQWRRQWCGTAKEQRTFAAGSQEPVLRTAELILGRLLVLNPPHQQLQTFLLLAALPPLLLHRLAHRVQLRGHVTALHALAQQSEVLIPRLRQRAQRLDLLLLDSEPLAAVARLLERLPHLLDDVNDAALQHLEVLVPDCGGGSAGRQRGSELWQRLPSHGILDVAYLHVIKPCPAVLKAFASLGKHRSQIAMACFELLDLFRKPLLHRTLVAEVCLKLLHLLQDLLLRDIGGRNHRPHIGGELVHALV
mmetsp:Transcript_75967/g.195722  ORF Transcript_75967/g.195722 Transcript_75967/m.195722 type:complete len:316 (-) Transcript_75967:180-1127(-)